MVYLHGDHLGSVSILTDSTGGKVSGQEYGAWGQVRSGDNSATTPIDFTGQHKDGTGLLYYGARYYDPVLGRFLSADTVVQGQVTGRATGDGRQADIGTPAPQALNPYSYVENNPINRVDPSGPVLVPQTYISNVIQYYNGYSYKAVDEGFNPRFTHDLVLQHVLGQLPVGEFQGNLQFTFIRDSLGLPQPGFQLDGLAPGSGAFFEVKEREDSVSGLTAVGRAIFLSNQYFNGCPGQVCPGNPRLTPLEARGLEGDFELEPVPTEIGVSYRSVHYSYEAAGLFTYTVTRNFSFYNQATPTAAPTYQPYPQPYPQPQPFPGPFPAPLPYPSP